ncbi:MAG: amidohydrolase family protein [Candidatus Brocadia sp.]|jgi:Cytosine deaminase and related metal-dependent hydrolases|nr:MAG: amidohydrolase family protein [Candidatus Brocadia sp.]
MKMIRAKYLIPEPERCIENGAVAVEDARIHRVGTFDEIKTLPDVDAIIDLGNAVILPGLINIHTHLDLTHLHNRIKPTSNFTHWVFQLLGARIRWKEADYTASIEKGIRCSVEAGTTTVADIANTEYSFSVLRKSPLRKVVFKEVIDLNPDHAEDVLAKAQSELAGFGYDGAVPVGINDPPVSPGKPGDDAGEIRGRHDLFCVGLSPHAPYSVSKELYRLVAQFARQKGLPLCTHIAETRDEIEFLTKGAGNFPTFLRQLRAMPPDWQPPGLTPIHYLKETGILENHPLLIHCNYITDAEISLIRSSGASVAFCPRSHRFFGHTNHPLPRLLGCGVNVGLGTDSLASNDTLSILDEMKFLFLHDAISPKTLISMATINGAKALGWELRVGRIREGFEADLCGIRLPDGDTRGVYGQLFDAGSKNIFTMISGVVCYQASSP